MKVSFITTVYNEEYSIKSFLESLLGQSKLPDEIIIVDGGSTDGTVAQISNFQIPNLKQNLSIKLIFQKGNRSVGRNKAIECANNEIIACSDAGCILDREWLKNIVEPFKDSMVDVVAGYYAGNPKSEFEKSLIPYALIMPDRVNENSFLPASRSMAFKKSIWKKMGGFPEKFSNNEDYVFANRLKKTRIKIVFERSAVVYWEPRKDIKEAFEMFYRFAKGDSESKIFRPKVALIFLRYLIFLVVLTIFLFTGQSFALNLLYLMMTLYIVWSISKNFRYTNSLASMYYLPLIQICSDLAVMWGTIRGIIG